MPSTPPDAPALTPGVRRRWVRVPREDGKQVHCSTIGLLPGSDRTVAAWFCGTGEGTPDTVVEWAAEGQDGAFGPPADAGASPGVACWNPVLVPTTDAGLLLYGRSGAHISAWRTWVARWDGAAFGTPVPLTDLVPDAEPDGGPVRTPSLVTAGRTLHGGSTEDWADPVRWDAHVDVEDRTVDPPRWTRRPVPLGRSRLRGAGVIQPALVGVPDGRVVALLRSTEGAVFRSESRDEGDTWSPAVPVDLPNNNSGIAAATLPDGRVVLAHNPVAGSWAVRCPLVLSTSEDAGLTWRAAAVVEDGRTPLDGHRPDLPSPGGLAAADSGVVTDGVGEYSYPTVLVADDRLLVSSTWQRRGIVLAEVPLSLL